VGGLRIRGRSALVRIPGRTLGVFAHLAVGVDSNDHVYIILAAPGAWSRRRFTRPPIPRSDASVPGAPCRVRSGRQPVKAWGVRAGSCPNRTTASRPTVMQPVPVGATAQRRPHPEVHPRGQVLQVSSLRLRHRRQQTTCSRSPRSRVSARREANEAYVADGYVQPRRRGVDMYSVKISRDWVAYGTSRRHLARQLQPRPPLAQHSRTPGALRQAVQHGMVTSCYRPNEKPHPGLHKDGSSLNETQV